LADPQALILGCSHAAGSEMHKLIPGEDDSYGYSRSYPVLIAQALGYQPKNHAIPGGSNDAMFRVWESKSHELTPNQDIVIACWSGPHRTEIWHPDEKTWLPMTVGTRIWHRRIPQDLTEKGMYTPLPDREEYLDYCKQWCTYGTDQETGRLNKIKNIIALNSMAEYLGIKVVNVNSFGSFPIEQYHWPVGETEFCNWCLDQKFPHTELGHFYHPAHVAFADYVLKGLV